MKPTISNRKLRGGYYTPEAIADFIVEWGCKTGDCNVILEPSCGDGSFLRAIQECDDRGICHSRIIAIELDSDEAKKAASNYGIEIRNDDFFNQAKSLLDDKSVDFVVGNPPFIRYQNFDEKSRDIAFQLLRDLGFRPNKLTNIWVPFLILSSYMLTDAGRLGMVIPAELLQVNYASECRRCLTNLFGKVTVISFKKLLFDCAQQEVILLLAEKTKGHQKTGICFIEVDSADDLDADAIINMPNSMYSVADNDTKWTSYYLDRSQRALISRISNHAMVKCTTDFFETNVGVVSGENSFFLLSLDEVKALGLEDSVLPIVSKTEQLKGITFQKGDFDLKANEGKKVFLFNPPHDQSNQLSKSELEYIQTGEQKGINQNYKCRIRDPWYKVPMSWMPTGFALRQVGYYPRILVNETDATSTDTVHKIRFLDGVDPYRLSAAFLNSYTFALAETMGRSYGGGVLTFEPSEIRKLRIPIANIEHLDPEYVDSLIRTGDIESVLDYTDRIILVEGLGLTDSEVNTLRNAWKRLLNRRMARRISKYRRKL